jgi:hypothetical protein
MVSKSFINAPAVSSLQLFFSGFSANRLLRRILIAQKSITLDEKLFMRIVTYDGKSTKNPRSPHTD